MNIMQNMLSACQQVISDLDMSFNVSKSYAIRFGRRYNKPCNPLFLCGEKIELCSTVKYLGAVFKSGLSLKSDHYDAKMAFFRGFNALHSKCAFSKSNLVGCHLIRSICIPILTYGCDVLNVQRSTMLKFDKLIDYGVRKVFDIQSDDNIKYIRNMVGLQSIETIIKTRACGFLLKVANMHGNTAPGIMLCRLAASKTPWLASFVDNSCHTQSLVHFIQACLHTLSSSVL